MFSHKSRTRSYLTKMFHVSKYSFVVIQILMIWYFMYLYNMQSYYIAREKSIFVNKIITSDYIVYLDPKNKSSYYKIPEINPYAKEILELETHAPNISCSGHNWVVCKFSRCKVKDHIFVDTSDVKCVYADILIENDERRHLGLPNVKIGRQKYILNDSDHVIINCIARNVTNNMTIRWEGYGAGLRKIVDTPILEKRDRLDVLIVMLDSASKNGFIRKMPKSYKYLTETLQASVFNGYNVLGDRASIILSLLTGKGEASFRLLKKRRIYQFPIPVWPNIDVRHFLFYKLKDHGYRTAYFEDSPWLGPIQEMYNGFNKPPADHYLRALLQTSFDEEHDRYCIGDTLVHRLMLNLTRQFFRLKGNHFCFTYIIGNSRPDFSIISSTDEDLMKLLDSLYKSGTFRKTLLIVMGDRGPRFNSKRTIAHGKLEERLPFLSILLPSILKRRRPEAQRNLELNTNMLTTAFDIHATILDVLNMQNEYVRKFYKGERTKFDRGLSLLSPIPGNRTCHDAGIDPYWCAGIEWRPVRDYNYVYEIIALQFQDFVNHMTAPYRDRCAIRTLKYILWLKGMVLKDRNDDFRRYVARYARNILMYKMQVILSPDSIYEVSATLDDSKDSMKFDTNYITRINKNNNSDCIRLTVPKLVDYCDCISYNSIKPLMLL